MPSIEDEEQTAADPLAEEHVAGAGDEPAEEKGEAGPAGLLAGNALGDLLLRRSCHRS